MNSKENHWVPCEQGAIVGAAGLIRARQNQESRRQFLRSAATASVVVAGSAFAGWTLVNQGDKRNALYDNPNYPGGIACTEVKRLLAEYIDKSITEEKVLTAMEIHLPECKHCRDKYNMMLDQQKA